MNKISNMNLIIKAISFSVLSASIFSCTNENTPQENFTKSSANSHEVVNNSAVVSKFAAGEAVYAKTCIACHQVNGKGIKGVFPPLASSDYLLEDVNRAIAQVIHGSEGEITVNGVLYSGVMPAQTITDEEVRDVINYILNSWGNDGGTVTLKEIHAQKSAG